MRVTARCAGWVFGVAFGFATLSGGVASATPVPVNWLPANGASSAGSTATGLAGANLSDVVLADRAIQSGAGYLEFTTDENDRLKAAGLGVRDASGGVEAIDFGFLLRADGTLSVVEKGSAVQSLG